MDEQANSFKDLTKNYDDIEGSTKFILVKTTFVEWKFLKPALSYVDPMNPLSGWPTLISVSCRLLLGEAEAEKNWILFRIFRFG